MVWKLCGTKGNRNEWEGVLFFWESENDRKTWDFPWIRVGSNSNELAENDKELEGMKTYHLSLTRADPKVECFFSLKVNDEFINWKSYDVYNGHHIQTNS